MCSLEMQDKVLLTWSPFVHVRVTRFGFPCAGSVSQDVKSLFVQRTTSRPRVKLLILDGMPIS